MGALLDGMVGVRQQAEIGNRLKRELDIEGVGAVQEDLFLEWWFGTEYAERRRLADSERKRRIPDKQQWAEVVAEFKQKNKKECQRLEDLFDEHSAEGLYTEDAIAMQQVEPLLQDALSGESRYTWI